MKQAPSFLLRSGEVEMKYLEDILAHWERAEVGLLDRVVHGQAETNDADEIGYLNEARAAIKQATRILKGLSLGALANLGIEKREGRDPPWPECLSDADLTGELAMAGLANDASLESALSREQDRRLRPQPQGQERQYNTIGELVSDLNSPESFLGGPCLEIGKVYKEPNSDKLVKITSGAYLSGAGIPNHWYWEIVDENHEPTGEKDYGYGWAGTPIERPDPEAR